MTYLNLYNSCVLTHGSINSIIYDLERSIFCTIPKDLGDFLDKNISKDLNDILSDFDEGIATNLKTYLSFLEKENFIYISESLIIIPRIEDENYTSSFHIEDIIIDSNDLTHLINSVNRITPSSEFLQIRCFFSLSIAELIYIVDLLVNLGFLNVELILMKNKEITKEKYIQYFHNNKIISRLVIYLSEDFDKINDNEIYFVTNNIKDESDCGIILESLFHPNLRTYLTSKSCNSCLYKKLSVDTKGEIRNCPSMPESYGNIKDTTLEEAINKPGFKKYWNLTKDDIEVCRDCEFRYICTDCRAYTERTHSENGLDTSKPLKCGYNPYTGEWSEWSTNPLKEKAINFYGMQDLKK